MLPSWTVVLPQLRRVSEDQHDDVEPAITVEIRNAAPR